MISIALLSWFDYNVYVTCSNSPSRSRERERCKEGDGVPAQLFASKDRRHPPVLSRLCYHRPLQGKQATITPCFWCQGTYLNLYITYLHHTLHTYTQGMAILLNILLTPTCHFLLSTLGALATVFTSLLHFSFLSSHLLVPPASFQLLHVFHPSIFSLVVLSSSFHLRVPASFLFPIHLIAQHVQRILASFLALFVAAFQIGRA